jgi:hypothetical protein
MLPYISIFAHLCCFVVTVALTQNNLSGKIPHSFSYLTKLRALRLEVRVWVLLPISIASCLYAKMSKTRPCMTFTLIYHSPFRSR